MRISFELLSFMTWMWCKDLQLAVPSLTVRSIECHVLLKFYEALFLYFDFHRIFVVGLLGCFVDLLPIYFILTKLPT